MAGERSARALARIDAALRRIELAAHRPEPSAGGEMEGRYKELWSRTNAALAELDGLIGTLEP